LSARESILRISLKNNLATLLKQELAYWKQRGKIKWVTLGDSNSKFFHSIAIVHKRKNSIASTHEGKAALLLETYKDRLGRADTTHNTFYVRALLNSSLQFSFLEEPFSTKEIDEVVKAFPSNKSPRLDGFNAEFSEEMLAYCQAVFL
jgi:hypothetical protein